MSDNSNTSFNKRKIKRKIKRIGGRDCVQLKVYIPVDLYERLLKVAPEIYGSFRGSLSHVVEMALRQYLPPSGERIRRNPKRKVVDVFKEVVKVIHEMVGGEQPPDMVPQGLIEKAIQEVRGHDPKTISKWFKLFEEQGLIKKSYKTKSGWVYELLII